MISTRPMKMLSLLLLVPLPLLGCGHGHGHDDHDDHDHDHDEDGDECGGHGHLHGDHCDCDDGYTRPDGDALTCVAIANGQGEVRFELELLTLAGAESARAVAITRDGSQVGGSAVVRIDDVLHTVGAIWSSDGYRLDVLPVAGLGASINAFGADGTAVGSSTMAEGQDYPRYPAVLVDGAWQVIPSLEAPQEFGWATGVSGDVIVGMAVDADEDTSAPWRSSNGETTPLGSFGGESGSAVGINADGFIVGWSQTSGEPFKSHGFVVPADGTLPADATVIEGLGGNTTFARAINASKQVTGDGADPDGTTHAFLWSEEEGIKIIHSPPEGVSFVLARAINTDGVVVGTGPTVDGPSLAWRWSAQHGAEQLDGLVELPQGWHVRNAWAIADDGSIVVTVHDDEDTALAAVLRPQ